MKIEKCPLCGSEVILCKDSSYATVPQYSITCLGCGMEFRIFRCGLVDATPYIEDPMLGAKEIIESFNRRAMPDGL